MHAHTVLQTLRAARGIGPYDDGGLYGLALPGLATKTSTKAGVVPMPIEPEAYDSQGTLGSGAGRRSHTLTIKAPGAVRVEAVQVNWPSVAEPITVHRISTDEYQLRTIASPMTPAGAREDVRLALVILRATWPDGSVVEHPNPTQVITAADTEILSLDRPGLRLGDRRPRKVGSSASFALAAPTGTTPSGSGTWWSAGDDDLEDEVAADLEVPDTEVEGPLLDDTEVDDLFVAPPWYKRPRTYVVGGVVLGLGGLGLTLLRR